MIALLAATPLETRLLRRKLPFRADPLVEGATFRCRVFRQELLLAHVGIGIASAAIGLTRLLERCHPELLLAFGCGGAYPGSDLLNGDLALATCECFGDLGVAEESGHRPLADLDLPDMESLFHQQLPLPSRWVDAAAAVLEAAPELQKIRIARGPCITVNTVSGTPAVCNALAHRWPGLCESMEGAALAQAAAIYDLPLIEVRGISNPCGSRDRADWDLKAGTEVAQRAVLRLLKDLPDLRRRACS